MWRRHQRVSGEAAVVLAAVASESLPYTHPRAGYPTAVAYRAARTPAIEPAPQRRRADGDAADDDDGM